MSYIKLVPSKFRVRVSDAQESLGETLSMSPCSQMPTVGW